MINEVKRWWVCDLIELNYIQGMRSHWQMM